MVLLQKECQLEPEEARKEGFEQEGGERDIEWVRVCYRAFGEHKTTLNAGSELHRLYNCIKLEDDRIKGDIKAF